MELRDATDEDWPAIWAVLRPIFAEGRTYTIPADIDADRARGIWMLPPPGRVVVALRDGVVVGTAKTGPNQLGPGSHVATASFAVDAASAGRGTGRALGRHVLDLARAEGYAAMQFNAVVATNVRAVGLWHSLGFSTVGIVPDAFRLPDGSTTGLHVMHQRL
ncbi:GNAT family N-acetyltransferase [Pseudonocardia sp. HH130630-07]|uniref:GNAT family N-acetyltransferase n=1 Tax=Pseudonocardia sp. HH130630-07 TaxID=1690815 RepID=UPI000814B7CD|nr:GNAT family N-acetyltransferase [Pseudonocardia sp. HH130630-07]ANY08557.1 GCN5 family acetyltransferase [Pseudonocardia sp. HH130630-07]